MTVPVVRVGGHAVSAEYAMAFSGNSDKTKKVYSKKGRAFTYQRSPIYQAKSLLYQQPPV